MARRVELSLFEACQDHKLPSWGPVDVVSMLSLQCL